MFPWKIEGGGEGYKFLSSQIPAWRITSYAREGKGNTVISY